MRALRSRIVVAALLVAVGCGGGPTASEAGQGGDGSGGGGSGSGAGGGGTGSGGGGSGSGGGAGAASFELDFSRPATSTTYDSCELSTYRILTFDEKQGSFSDGFRCDSAGGTPTTIQAAVKLDFTKTGSTPCGTVKAPASGKVVEVWVLATATVTKRGKAHVAHGQLTCTDGNGHRYVVLRFVSPSTIDVTATGKVRLAAAVDVGRAIVEHGNCDESCDEDVEDSDAEAQADSKHGSISFESQCSLEKGD